MAILLKDLCKSFGAKRVIHNLSYSFAPDAITCVIGPSGCGKTTLLRMIAGLTPPDSGSIDNLPDRCAMVFQEDRLIDHLSPLANISIVQPRSYPQSRIRQALEAVGLGDAIAQPARELSGGMQRRVSIVRALLYDAPLLLMDEPFKGLDVATRDAVIRFAQPLMAGRTTLIVTHDPDEWSLLGRNLLKLSADLNAHA